MEPKGFILEETDIDSSSYSHSFSNRLSGGDITFSDNLQSFDFNIGRINIETFIFELPAGEYVMECSIDQASPYGQSEGSFIASSQRVIISDTTKTIYPEVKPTCSLFLVEDHDHQLNEAPSMIERYASGEGYFKSYPMALDTATGLFYSYFIPDPNPENPSAFLWLYPRNTACETCGISTADLINGKIYRIKILE